MPPDALIRLRLLCMSDTPAVLSEDEGEQLGTSHVSLLWARIHSLDWQLWGVSRTLQSEQSQSESWIVLIQDIRAELAVLQSQLTLLQTRVQRREHALDLNSLD